MKLTSFIRRCKADHGQVSVLFAFVLVILLGAAGAAVDIGYVDLKKQSLQSAVDAGALAGAQSLALGTATSSAQTTAQNVAADNVSTAAYHPVASGNQMTVTGSETVRSYFARVFGVSHFSIAATASAAYGPIRSAGGVVPIGVAKSAVQAAEQNPNTQVSLTDPQSPGNWGFLRIDGNGAIVVEDGIKYGSKSPVTYQEQIEPKPGVNSQDVQDAIAYRIDPVRNPSGDPVGSPPGCSSYTTATTACARVVMLPVVEGYGNGSSTSVTVDGFAEFYISGYNGSGSIVGYYIKTVSPGEINTSSTALNFGVESAVLTH